MSSIFSKIISGEIPSYKIAEDDRHIAFLDAMPLVKGHTLVVPKKETDLIFDLESEDYKELGLHISVTAGIFITKSIIYPKGRR